MSEPRDAAAGASQAPPDDGAAALPEAPAQVEAPAPVAPEVEEAVRALEVRLGTPLPDRALAMAALTHKSFVNEHRDEGLVDNERLEFLGDAVIDLAVSHRLMERFPGAREGELSKMRAAVVDEQGLAAMARALDLGPLLRLGRGEELTGGRGKSSLLADAMEAVVAAVFLGAGLRPVLEIADRFLGEAFARAAAGTLDRDFKTQLQELAQSRLRATPRYRVVAEHGPDHCKTFEVETDLRGEVLGRGSGRSKKDAEQAAAKLAIDLLGRRFAEGLLPVLAPAAEVAPEAVPEASPPADVTAAVVAPGPTQQAPAAPAQAVQREPPLPEEGAGDGAAVVAAEAPPKASPRPRARRATATPRRAGPARQPRARAKPREPKARKQASPRGGAAARPRRRR